MNAASRNVRRLVCFATVTACAALAFCSTSMGQEKPPSPLANIKWQKGPSVASLGNIAEVRLPEGFMFAGAGDTRLLMEAMENPTSGSELGLLGPENLDWFVVFEFDEAGYIRDDEKDKLDADAMLKSIRAGNEEGNKERQKRGWATMTIVGWEQPPHYDPATHNLEWAIRGESQGKPVVNYNTRILGRRGVMRATLVTDPGTLAQTLPSFKTVLGGYAFKQGSRYEQYVSGDKVAKYGLTALVTGGAAAVAVKTGLFKYLWKLIVVIFIAIGAFFKRVFSAIKRFFGGAPDREPGR